jgi:hypothetical protein
MTLNTTKIPVSSIILDETIYPRKAIGPKQLTEEEARDTARRPPMLYCCPKLTASSAASQRAIF